MTAIFISSSVLLILYILLFLYYRTGWKNIPGTGSVHRDILPSTRISIIVPARNEEKNLPALLASLSAQSYPPELFEVFIVDDHSSDGTVAMVESHPNPNIKLVSLEKFINGPINSYKKKAIEVGILQSNGRLIVTTDADCIVPKNWLLAIALFYEKYNPAIIAAPVLINPGNSLISVFQALDFMVLQGITGAAVQKKNTLHVQWG